MKNRLSVLDSIRGLAAFVVVIYHFTYRYYEIYPQSNQLFFSFYEGKYGVQAFFIISGFVIFMSLNNINKPIDFIINRFIRLYPIFWICVILTFTIVSIYGLEGRETTLIQMLLNLSMISNQFGIQNVDGVYWTLLYELKFYFWIFIIYISSNLKNIEKISLFYICIILIFNILNLEQYLAYKILNQIFIFDYLVYFISGILFYNIYYNQVSKITFLTLVLSFLLCNITSYYHDDFWIISFIYIIFLLFSFHKLNWLSNKYLIVLGTISYPLYLIHQNIGYIVLNYLFSIKIIPILSFFITLIIVLLIALFLTYFLEKKLISLLKKLYTNNKNIMYVYFNKKSVFRFLIKHPIEK